MSPLFPELSDGLAAAAERAARPRRRRVLPVLGSSLAVVAVAGVATAATGVWHPQVGDDRRGTPSISARPIPAELTSRLEVLRRPGTAVDRSAEVRRILKYVGRGYRGVRTDAVRLLAPGTPTMGAQILIPAERAHGIDNALCLYVVDLADGAGSTCATTADVIAGKAVLLTATPAPLTAPERRKSARAMREAVAKNKAQRRALRARLAPLPDDPGARRRKLERAYAAANLNGVRVVLPRPRFTQTTYVGLVPDGVATVTRSASDGTVTANVRNNSFTIRVPGGTMARGTFRWSATDGATIKTVESP
jgi:hypothetical protein